MRCQNCGSINWLIDDSRFLEFSRNVRKEHKELAKPSAKSFQYQRTLPGMKKHEKVEQKRVKDVSTLPDLSPSISSPEFSDQIVLNL